MTNKGFSAEEAQKAVTAIFEFLNGNLLKTLKSLGLSPEQCTMLGGFEFTTADIVTGSGLGLATVDAVLAAFCFPDDGNPTFTALHEFNAANAFPILKGGTANTPSFSMRAWPKRYTKRRSIGWRQISLMRRLRWQIAVSSRRDLLPIDWKKFTAGPRCFGTSTSGRRRHARRRSAR